MEVCYRHPGRETRVSCSACGRPICPDCMTQTPVGMRCPECARHRTKVKTVRSQSSVPTVTLTLIIVMSVIQVASFLSGAGAIGGTSGASVLVDHGALSRPEIAAGQYWRLVTAGFLHAGFLHLFFNMFALYILGSLLEPAIGRLRFSLVFGASLLAGSFGALLLQPNAPTVGASGAIFGLMGAGVVALRKSGINPMQSGLGLWILLNLLLTFTIPGLSIGGHLGGLIGGLLAGVVLFELPHRMSLPNVVAEASVVVIGLLAVFGSVAVSAV
jgi:membrane associated rhomboid family serine protease